MFTGLSINIPVGILKRQTRRLELRSMESTKASSMTPAAARVLGTASRLFYERGIRAVGMEALAEEAGVTKVTIYKNFGSKDGLVAAYLRARDERWRRWLVEAVARRADTPRARLLAVFDALGEWLGGQEGLRGCAFVNASTEITDISHPARAVIEEQKQWMREYFRRLASDAGVEEPEELAEKLMILYEGATVNFTMRIGAEPTGQAREIAEALLG
jgi:AcrR family transcriptional regulator